MVYIKFLRFILNFFDLFHQRKVLALFKKKFTNPITIIDVGAHFGETIITFKKNFNIKKIYSFEASPINFEILKKKFSNNLKNIEIHNFGIGAHISEDVIN